MYAECELTAILKGYRSILCIVASFLLEYTKRLVRIGHTIGVEERVLALTRIALQGCSRLDALKRVLVARFCCCSSASLGESVVCCGYVQRLHGKKIQMVVSVYVALFRLGRGELALVCRRSCILKSLHKIINGPMLHARCLSLLKTVSCPCGFTKGR